MSYNHASYVKNRESRYTYADQRGVIEWLCSLRMKQFMKRCKNQERIFTYIVQRGVVEGL